MSADRFDQLRRLEAMLFASAEPLSGPALAARLPEGANVEELLGELRDLYANRGVNLVRRGKSWAFRTAPDIAPWLKLESTVQRKLSRAATETLAIIAYQQPVTRAEIEEIRGVAPGRGTLDILLEAGWIKPRGRRRVAGRPITWGTTETFLDAFGLESLDALPGIDELKAAGLLDRRAGMAAIAMRQSELDQAGAETRESEDGRDTDEEEAADDADARQIEAATP